MANSTDQHEVGPPANDAELKAFTDVVAQALFFPGVDLDVWIRREGIENVRVVRRNGEVVGGLIVQRMGQWFGGRSVAMGAVRTVGVAAEHRGSGAGSALMRASLEEMHRDGVPISVLFPATQPVYRRPGYEIAGVRMGYRLSTHAIDTRDRTLSIRPIDEKAHGLLRELYRTRAGETSGNVDRNDWAWDRVLDPPRWSNPAHGYLVERDGSPEGYIVFGHKAGTTYHDNGIEVTDLVALTADAGRRILSFLADHRSMAQAVRWYGPPVEPLGYLLAEQKFCVDDRIDWMLRLVDVGAALEARGYAQGVSGELHLDVTDDVLPHNNARLILEVGDRQARVRRGGRGDLKIDVRGLAPLYTGHMTPQALRTVGYTDGSEDALASAAVLFAGPAPWMPDIF